MKVYFRTQLGDGLIEKGKILRLVASKRTYIVTGDKEEDVIRLTSFDDEAEGMQVFEQIISRIVQPTAREVEKGIIYIDLG